MKEDSDWSPKEAERRMAEIREEIDAVDADLVRLLNARAALSIEVGRIKAGAGDLVFKPSREKELLERLIIENPGPLPEKQLRSIYREILSSSRRLQRPQRVAYLGPEGTFSYFAGVEFLGHSADFISKHGLEEVFRAVSGAETELGIIPLENSLHGTVGQSLDLFMSHEVFIQSEIFCRISQSVIGRADSLTEIGTIYTHPQPLAQCARWISTHLPEAVVVTTESTAAAASRAARDTNSVSIGHKGLAQLFGLNVLATGVEDLAENWTRFVVIARAEAVGGTREKTSLLFSLPDEPGSLVSVLGVLSGRGVNMKKLESRPMRGETWKYVFFVDVECDLESPDYADLRGVLQERCHVLRILGSYPAGPYLDVSEADPGPRATGGVP